VTKNRDGEDNQLLGARWQFILALQRVLPIVFERLREGVYPEYARQADQKPKYWSFGWRFDTWQTCSDRENLVTPYLLDWARGYNLEGQTWILEGALQTLYFWLGSVASRESLDVWGFHSSAVIPILVGDEEHRFRFEDWGWDPQFWPERSWSAHVRESFEKELSSHVSQVRELVESRGAVPAISRFRIEHFEWLALYQCGGHTLEQIQLRYPHLGSRTTISKGMHQAARLIDIQVRPKSRKLKSY
jgi:hypothetical protein